MKKYFSFALMALLMCGLTLSVASCKDDDKNDNENNGEDMEQAISTGGEMTLAETQLASLISNFCAVEAEELLARPDWKGKTYEVALGLVLNESRPTVRTIAVRSLEAADAQACSLLDALGIDYLSPAGFTFSDSEVGTVSYRHGGGADANTLAVINLDVKALPGITQLQMVRELPSNDYGDGYYQMGDIIQKTRDGNLWICVLPAEHVGGPAHFITFWTDHPTETCGWGKYNDVVYAAKQPMASMLMLSNWMRLFLMNDKNYTALLKNVRFKLGAHAPVDDLIPSTEEARQELIAALQMKGTNVKDREPLSSFLIDDYKWDGIGNDANGRTIAPRGRLLCDKFRWSAGFTYDYWVPTLSWVSLDDGAEFEDCIKEEPKQSEGKHFKFEYSKETKARTRYLTEAATSVNSYFFVKTAIHWQHKYFTLNGKPKQWAIFDFTLDWSKHPTQNANWTDQSKSWVCRNITSSEMTIIDNGEPRNEYENVWLELRDLGWFEGDKSYMENEEDDDDDEDE